MTAVFTRELVADGAHGLTFHEYRKTSVTRAARIDGPFTVQTNEGPLTCQDGYLAIDARGWPYPIDAEEFGLIYEPATADTA